MLRFDNTEKLKDACDSGEIKIPAIEKGNQTCMFANGEPVEPTASSRWKSGKGKVKSSYEQNGYFYYVVSWEGGKRETVEREKDIQKIS